MSLISAGFISLDSTFKSISKIRSASNLYLFYFALLVGYTTRQLMDYFTEAFSSLSLVSAFLGCFLHVIVHDT